MRLCIAFLGIVSLAAIAHGQGAVQISLAGSILPIGGARIEFDVVPSFEHHPELELHLDWQLARGTSAEDLALILDRELANRHIGHVVLGVHDGTPQAAGLLIDSAVSVGLRLGHGLSADLTLPDRSPAAIRILPPSDVKRDSSLLIDATTYHPVSKERGRLHVEIPLEAKSNSPAISERLMTAAIAQKWLGERVNHDAWKPGTSSEGALPIGCSITFGNTESDWRLELEIDTPRR
jgi:hypothetical protein